MNTCCCSAPAPSPPANRASAPLTSGLAAATTPKRISIKSKRPRIRKPKRAQKAARVKSPRGSGGSMTVKRTLPVFDRFIQHLRAAWAELPDTEARMKKGAQLLEDLVNDQAMREASKNWPSTEGRKNLLFYEDPDYGFAI